jgi:hypothetical protein
MRNSSGSAAAKNTPKINKRDVAVRAKTIHAAYIGKKA